MKLATPSNGLAYSLFVRPFMVTMAIMAGSIFSAPAAQAQPNPTSSSLWAMTSVCGTSEPTIAA